jgi:hypothetical protein
MVLQFKFLLVDENEPQARNEWTASLHTCRLFKGGPASLKVHAWIAIPPSRLRILFARLNGYLLLRMGGEGIKELAEKSARDGFHRAVMLRPAIGRLMIGTE